MIGRVSASSDRVTMANALTQTCETSVHRATMPEARRHGIRTSNAIDAKKRIYRHPITTSNNSNPLQKSVASIDAILLDKFLRCIYKYRDTSFVQISSNLCRIALAVKN